MENNLKFQAALRNHREMVLNFIVLPYYITLFVNIYIVFFILM